jgi:hypothetical protein
MASTLVTVIGQFLHPPLGLCSLQLVTQTHRDRVVYTRVRGPLQVDAFGIHVVITDFPAGYGRRDVTAGPVEFDTRVMEIAALHTLLNASLYSDRLESRRGSNTLMFSEAAPQSVEVWTAPGLTASVYWVLLL